jgi:hypothetical protein
MWCLQYTVSDSHSSNPLTFRTTFCRPVSRKIRINKTEIVFLTLMEPLSVFPRRQGRLLRRATLLACVLLWIRCDRLCFLLSVTRPTFNCFDRLLRWVVRERQVEYCDATEEWVEFYNPPGVSGKLDTCSQKENHVISNR